MSVEPQPFNGWWTFGNSTSDEYKSEHNGEIAARYPCDLALVQCKDLLWCVCYIAIMILPCTSLWAGALLFGMQQYGSGCSHLLNESLPPPTHPGTCQDRYSPPWRLTGGEGKLWMTKSCISNHWATWLQRAHKKMHTTQGGCSKQVIHK